MNTHVKYLAGAALALALSSQASFAQQKTVTLMAYSGLFQERYTKAVVEPFMKANPDIKVEYFPLPNSAQMLGSLRAQKAAPQADVVIMDVSVSKAATDENLFIKIDEKNVPAVAELYPTARIADVAGVAVTFDNLVLIYNSDFIKEAPKSWFELADKKYAGKVTFNGMPDIQGLSLVLILDKARGGTNYLQNVDKGIAAMGEIAPNILTWEPKPEPYPVIIAGQAHLGAGVERARAGQCRHLERKAQGDASGGRQRLPDQHDQSRGKPPRQGRGREVRQLCDRHDGAEGVHRGNVLCAGQRQGADRGRRDRPHRREEHGQGRGGRLDRASPRCATGSWSSGAAACCRSAAERVTCRTRKAALAESPAVLSCRCAD